MSNTLNLGNGDWATKENSLLGYNSENGNYKPLPFDFTRASNGTFVNKSGLIETAANGVPRIDFLGNTSGALKLEGQSTNLITYSSDFTKLTKTNTIITSNQAISPDGTQNADELTGSGFARAIYAIGNGDITVSCYVKSNDGTDKNFVMGAGSLGSIGNETFTATSEWQRFTHTFSTTAQSTDFGFFSTGGVDLGLYLYGFQLEQGSYATSLINTQGSAVTRVADACSQTVPTGIIGQTEGTVFVDFNIDSLENQTNDPIVLSFNSSNFIEVFDNGRVNYYDGTGNIDINLTSYGLTSGRHKFGIAYNINDVAFYIDGTLAGTDTSCSPSAKSSLYLGYTNVNFLPFIYYNEVKLYNTRLSNSELAALTSL